MIPAAWLLRREGFFSVKTVVKWNIWKICSMQNGSSHTFILTFRFDLREREREREDSEIAIHRWLVRVLLFYMLLCVFGLGWIFLHVFADLSIPLFPQITCLILYDLNFCPFSQKLVFKKNKKKKRKKTSHPNLKRTINHLKPTKKTRSQAPDQTSITTPRYNFLW